MTDAQQLIIRLQGRGSVGLHTVQQAAHSPDGLSQLCCTVIVLPLVNGLVNEHELLPGIILVLCICIRIKVHRRHRTANHFCICCAVLHSGAGTFSLLPACTALPAGLVAYDDTMLGERVHNVSQLLR